MSEPTKSAAVVVHEDVSNALVPASEAERVMGMIQDGAAKGLSVETMGKMMDLYERVQERSARVAYFNALAKFKREIPRITHDKDTSKATNAGGKFSFTYASKAAIMAAIQPHLDANGLFLTFDTEPSEKAGWLVEVATLHHVDGHKETSRVAMPTDSTLPIGSQQKVGSAMSYGQRYAIIAVLGLSLDEPGDEAAPVARVTDEQSATLQALMDETKVDRAKWLAHYGIAAVSDLPANLYQKAVQSLEARRKAVKS